MDYDIIKYQHVCKIGSTDIEGLLDGECYVYPKIDGTNCPIWFDKELNKSLLLKRTSLPLKSHLSKIKFLSLIWQSAIFWQIFKSETSKVFIRWNLLRILKINESTGKTNKVLNDLYFSLRFGKKEKKLYTK